MSRPILALTLPLLALLAGCGAHPQGSSQPQAAPVIQAAPSGQFGHLSPIHLAPGEYFDGWGVAAGSTPGGVGSWATPERYFFGTTTVHPVVAGRPSLSTGTHTLRDSQGVPVLIVIDGDMR